MTVTPLRVLVVSDDPALIAAVVAVETAFDVAGTADVVHDDRIYLAGGERCDLGQRSAIGGSRLVAMKVVKDEARLLEKPIFRITNDALRNVVETLVFLMLVVAQPALRTVAVAASLEP